MTQRGRDLKTSVRMAHRSTSNHSRQHNYQLSKGKNKNWDFVSHRLVGRGTFGTVCYATLQATNQEIAVKKVLQDEHYKNRELEIIRDLDHPNIVKLLHSYFTKQQRQLDDQPKEQIYLHLLMQYVPEDLFRLTRFFHKGQGKKFPNILIKAYSYQLLRGLAYLKDCGICHRDIKPRNILVNPKNHQLKICDFGSAKKIVKGEPNLAYVCSRFYRAPELAFGNTNYNCSCDLWSAGCVIAEMFLGQPLFFSQSSMDHIVSIISLMGSPSKSDYELFSIPPEISSNFPTIKPKKMSRILRHADPLLISLVSQLLVYDSSKRLDPFQALNHPYFDELKTCKINSQSLFHLYSFTESQRILHRDQIRLICQ